MGIIQYPATLSGEVGVLGATKFMVSTDNLATVTTAGYLNNIDSAVYPISRSDVISCLYSFNQQTGAGTLGIFTVAISGTGVITLSSWISGGDVLLPVVSGDFASFNGTTGQIKDSGISPSNAAKTKAVMADAAVIANHIGVFTDTAGTISDDAAIAINGGNIQAGLSGTAGYLASFPTTAATGSLRLTAASNSGDTVTSITNAAMAQASTITIPDPGAASASFVLNAGANTLAAGASIRFPKATGTEAGGTVMINAQSGSLTTSALTTISGGNYVITWSNSFILTTSVILVTPQGGTSTVTDVNIAAVPSAPGVCTLTIFNNSGGAALDGTLILGFMVV